VQAGIPSALLSNGINITHGAIFIHQNRRYTSLIQNPISPTLPHHTPQPLTHFIFLLYTGVQPTTTKRSTSRNVSIKASSSSDMVQMIKQKNADNQVMIYSKTYCPYCSQVKSLFSQLNIPTKVVELDQLEDGDAVHEALIEVIGKRTVPQVFIGNVHVGGCDDTMAAKSSGQLNKLLADAGVTV
jgi:glutaredoxin